MSRHVSVRPRYPMRGGTHEGTGDPPTKPPPKPSDAGRSATPPHLRKKVSRAQKALRYLRRGR